METHDDLERRLTRRLSLLHHSPLSPQGSRSRSATPAAAPTADKGGVCLRRPTSAGGTADDDPDSGGDGGDEANATNTNTADIATTKAKHAFVSAGGSARAAPTAAGAGGAR